MKCVYQRLRCRTENWKVEFSANVNIKIQSGETDTVLTSEEAKFLKRLLNQHERREKQSKTKAGPISRARISEESSDYSTSKEFQKLFEETDDSISSEEESQNMPESQYKIVPNVFMDMKKYMAMKYYGSDEENYLNQPCSSSSANFRADQYRKLCQDDRHSSGEDTINKYTTCKAYRPARYGKKNAKTQKRKRRKAVFLEEELRDLELHEEGYFELRCMRGRIRLNELKNRRCRQLSCEIEDGGVFKFATLSEVLLERGLLPNDIICCSLCRLLISNTLREEFFFSPCDCIEKFVHTKCALLHQKKMVRQKCKDCQKFNTDRTVCRATASAIETLEELELYRLNKELTKEKVILKENKEFPDRLPTEFEKDCFICLDSRISREDTLEMLDSTIIKSCQCNVTAHNECLVQSLLQRRTCGYCNYRIKFTIIGPKLGYVNSEVGLTTFFLLTSVVTTAFFMAYITCNYIQVPVHVINMIIHNFCVAMIVILSTYYIAAIIGVSKRKSKEWNKKCAVVIKPYQLSNTIKDDKTKRASVNRKKHYEEIPYEESANLLEWDSGS